jgi:hypothetical protein
VNKYIYVCYIKSLIVTINRIFLYVYVFVLIKFKKKKFKKMFGHFLKELKEHDALKIKLNFTELFKVVNKRCNYKIY